MRLGARLAIATLVSATFVVGVAAQTSTEQSQVREIQRLEQARLEAGRAGRSIVSFNSDDYADIIPPGTMRTNRDLAAGVAPRPNAWQAPDTKVRIFGDAAVVTGTLGSPEGDPGKRDRILRVWARQNGSWKAVGYHGTWIGERSDARPLVSSPGPSAPAFQAKNATEQTIWKLHENIEQASAAADAKRYGQLVTDDFVRVVETGEARSREAWLSGMSTRTPGAVSLQRNVRLRVFGDLAIMTYQNYGPGTPANPVMLMTRIFVKQSGEWKLFLTQSTLARQPAPPA